MHQAESISDFYKRLRGPAPTGAAMDKAGIGHINIFHRESCSVVSPYSRRDFYKVSLIIGTGKIYALPKYFFCQRTKLMHSESLINENDKLSSIAEHFYNASGDNDDTGANKEI